MNLYNNTVFDISKELTRQYSTSFYTATKLFSTETRQALFRSKVLHRPKYSLKKLDKMEWTMGYLTFYIGLNRKLPELNQHNYYLGTNYEEYGKNVLKKPQLAPKTLLLCKCGIKTQPRLCATRMRKPFFRLPGTEFAVQT